MSQLTEPTTLVIHHDDLGASHSANLAFVELMDKGITTSGSVMVPCPWFAELVGIAHQRPDLDIGVHLTLTAEFKHYKWGPLSGIGHGMTDDNGHFWPTVREARQADPKAVEAEFRAQMDVALASGVDVTHIDSHMCSAWAPEFIDIFIRLGRDYRLPIVLPRAITTFGVDPSYYTDRLADLDARHNQIFETFLVTPFSKPNPTAMDYADLFAAAKPGINYCAFHFAKPADISGFSHLASTCEAEYALFSSGTITDQLSRDGFALSNMRVLRDQLRAHLDA